jgi:hypothetical protein
MSILLEQAIDQLVDFIDPASEVEANYHRREDIREALKDFAQAIIAASRDEVCW